MRCLILLFIIIITADCSAQRKSLPAIDTLLNKADYQQVLNKLDSLQKTNKAPNGAVNYYRLLCYYDMKEYNEGTRLSTKYISEYTNLDSVLINLYDMQVNLLMDNQNYEAAIKTVYKVLKLDPKNADHYVNLSVLYGFNKQISMSLKALRDGLKVDNKNVFIYNNLAYYNGHYKHYLQAIKYANIGIKLKQDSFSTGYFYNNRGYAEMKLHRLKKANRDIDLAMIWNSTNCYAYYYKALAILDTKNYFEVCKYVKLSETYGGQKLVEGLKYKYCH